MRKLFSQKILLLMGVIALLIVGGFFFGGPPPRGFFGPFSGRPATVPAEASPVQTFRVFSGDVIDVYQNPAEFGSPIVAYKKGGQQVVWCIYADGFQTNDTAELRFTNSYSGIFWKRVVEGEVLWRYGREKMLWHINRRGRLSSYYYDF